MKLILLMTSIALLFSCSDDNSVGINYKEKLRALVRSGDMNTLEEVNADWENSDLNGIIFLEKDYNNIYAISINSDGSVDSSIKEFTTYDAFSVLFDSNIDGIDVNNFKINEHILDKDRDRDESGIYRIYNKLIEYSFESNSNYIEIDGTDQFENINDSLNLGEAIMLKNISRGDSVNRNTGIVLDWAGSGTTIKVDLAHAGNYGSQEVTESTVTRVIWYEQNTGSLDLLPHISKLDLNGIYHLKVALYEPHYINLKNDKKILVIVKSSHNLSFNLLE